MPAGALAVQLVRTVVSLGIALVFTLVFAPYYFRPVDLKQIC